MHYSLIEKEVQSSANTFECPNTTNPYHECTDYCKERWVSSNSIYLGSTGKNDPSMMWGSGEVGGH